MARPRFQDLPPGFVPLTPQRFRTGPGPRYVPDVVARARVLVEGTSLSQAAIAARVGIGVTTVGRWIIRHRWDRPDGAERWTCLVAAQRAGFGPALRAGYERLAVAAGREAERLRATGEGPETAARAEALAAAARRAGRRYEERSGVGASPTATNGGSGLVRLTGQPKGRRGKRPGDDVSRRARELMEGTTLRQADIARRLGIDHATLVSWKQAGGWTRPAHAPGRFGHSRPTAGDLHGVERRTEARRRLAEAMRLVDGQVGADVAWIETLAEAYRGLRSVAAELARLPLPGPDGSRPRRRRVRPAPRSPA